MHAMGHIIQEAQLLLVSDDPYTLKNGVALLKPHLNVAIFNPLKCVFIKHIDVAF